MTEIQPLLLECFMIYLVAVNVITALITLIDKHRATRNAWRIPEVTLLLLGAIGGAFGEWITMLVIRHKTKHMKFMLLLPLFFTSHTVLLGWLAIRYFL